MSYQFLYERLFPEAAGQVVPYFVDNQFKFSTTKQHFDQPKPATGAPFTKTPLLTAEEMEQVVQSSQAAAKEWAAVPISVRTRKMQKVLQLIEQYTEDIARDLTEEHGKTNVDAKGEIMRGVEIVEESLSSTSVIKGEFMQRIAKNTNTYSMYEPLGVTASIMPFNFPFMCPMWSIPISLVCGNSVILKPSERCPRAALNIAAIFMKAGIPKGCVNIMHGQHDAVNLLCDHPLVQSVSFVGSTPAGDHIYKRCAVAGKRAQCNMGAKNYIVIMPDADHSAAIAGLVGSAFGAAGQRCMANTIGIFVGDASTEIMDGFISAAKNVQPGEGNAAKTELGPLISKESKARAIAIIEKSIAQGATLAVDGRNVVVPGYEHGNFIGATILTDVKPGMECYEQEIFAPVFSVLHVDTLEDALHLINSNPNGNGTAIYTKSGAVARKYSQEVEVGQVGINTPIPVGLYYLGFTGWRASFRGDLHFYGNDGFRFFTRKRTIIENWAYEQKAMKYDMSFPIAK